MLVYVSGKISGDLQWKSKFQGAEVFLQNKGHSVLSPRMIDVVMDYEKYMHIDFAMLDVADAIFLLDDWEDSPGARREVEYAKQNGLKILTRELINSENGVTNEPCHETQ